MKNKALLLFIAILLFGCSFGNLYTTKPLPKVYSLEQVTMQKLVSTYMNKSQTSVGTVEGIYSVSGLVTRSGKNLMGGEDKDKVVDRKENYAKVAIIRDPTHASREYYELMLDKEYAISLSVIGEFSAMTDGNILIYKHFEKNGKSSESFTFTYDSSKDILEGVRTENNGNHTITYKLTYLKILPKAR